MSDEPKWLPKGERPTVPGVYAIHSQYGFQGLVTANSGNWEGWITYIDRDADIYDARDSFYDKTSFFGPIQEPADE
jgi:hypothetical protein